LETKELTCNKCGAPLKTPFGAQVLTCEYCGAAMAVSGDEWKAIQKHTMLENRVDPDKALEVAKTWIKGGMIDGIIRHDLAEKSQIGEISAKYVPYWIIPSSADANYSGRKGASALIEQQARQMGGGLAGALGGIMGGAVLGRYGGQQRVSSRLTRAFNQPVVAVRSLSQYETDNYEFVVQSKQLFDPNKIQKGIEVLNGDVSESEAAERAKGLVSTKMEAEAKRACDALDSVSTQVTTQEGELLHAPIWFVKYVYDNQEFFILIDGSNGKVMKGGKPATTIKLTVPNV
jgi:hypothetical protein